MTVLEDLIANAEALTSPDLRAALAQPEAPGKRDEVDADKLAKKAGAAIVAFTVRGDAAQGHVVTFVARDTTEADDGTEVDVSSKGFFPLDEVKVSRSGGQTSRRTSGSGGGSGSGSSGSGSDGSGQDDTPAGLPDDFPSNAKDSIARIKADNSLDLDAVEAAEKGREDGPRSTVLDAIESARQPSE